MNSKKKSLPQTQETPSRFRNTIGKVMLRRNSRCTSCGLCAKLCPYGVHPRYDNYTRPVRPKSHKCIGYACKQNDPTEFH